MGDTLSVSMDTSKDVAIPTLEEEAAKYDNLDSSAEDRPEWLPEKFKSAEDLARAYSELEKKLGTRTPAQEEKVAETNSTEEAEADTGEGDEQETPTAEEQAREVTEKAGLNFDELSKSYWEDGSLTEAQYAKLDEAGIPKAIVDQFIAGQEALIDSTRQSVFNSVGGENNYNAMTEWAANNFSPEEIAAYNGAVNSGDSASAMMAVKGLKARFDATVGFEPQREVRGETARAGATTYRSISEMEKDMADPRYKNDPAFRRDVERKLARSDIF